MKGGGSTWDDDMLCRLGSPYMASMWAFTSTLLRERASYALSPWLCLEVGMRSRRGIPLRSKCMRLMPAGGARVLAILTPQALLSRLPAYHGIVLVNTELQQSNRRPGYKSHVTVPPTPSAIKDID